MAWPYHFYLNPTKAEQVARREALNQYALLAHVSALAPGLVYFVYCLVKSTLLSGGSKKASYQAVPDSPTLKSRRLANAGAANALFMKLKWWLRGPVMLGPTFMGGRDQWVVGLGWAAWLVFLCFAGTGDDYLHLTKRFGIVAASQLPIQYLLGLKGLNPFAFVFGTSHEQVNRFHQVLGRIIYGLLLSHVTLYLNFFAQNGLLGKRLTAPVVIFGILAMNSLHVLMATAVPPVRQWSYRVFFVTHLTVIFVIPVLLFFHAQPARPYVLEAMLVFIVDLAFRKATTITSAASVELIPGTNLVKVSAPVPPKKLEQFRERPGSHIYLNLPAASQPTGSAISHLLFMVLYHPFSVAGVDEENNQVNLVARVRNGPMTRQLEYLARTASDGRKVRINIEGPYGHMGMNFDKVSGYDVDRILLVAGGIGATFTVPLYRGILRENPSAKVHLAWAVRQVADTSWAVASTSGKSVLADENVNIYVTRNSLNAASDRSANGAVELSTLNRGRGKSASQYVEMRPNLKRIVDDLFRAGSEERIAVLACGPEKMTLELRELVTPWVMKGRQAFWHNETFGL